MNWNEIEEKFIVWEENLPDGVCEIAVSDPRFLARLAWHASVGENAHAIVEILPDKNA
jgi:hypothetical protein